MGMQDPHPFNFVELKDKNVQVDSKTLLLGAIFLLLLLISSFSLLYFLYVCVRRGRLAIARPSISPEAQTHDQPPSTGLDKATIGCLPIVFYGSSPIAAGDFRSGECSICLGVFQDGEKVKVLPLCRHCFHSQCVDKWLLTRSSCPLCRACVVRVDSLAHSDACEV